MGTPGFLRHRHLVAEKITKEERAEKRSRKGSEDPDESILNLRKRTEDADELIKKQNAQLQTMYQKWVKRCKGDQAEEEIRWEKATALIKDSVGLSQADGGHKVGVVDKLEKGGTGHWVDVAEMY